MGTQETPDERGRQERQHRQRRARAASGIELTRECRTVLAFPDLETLTPVEKPSNPERVLWRLAAFYDVVRDALGRDTYPHPLGVWLNPADAVRLRRWVEAPLSVRLKVGRPVEHRARVQDYWTDKGPASSALVPPGEIIITARAYEGFDNAVRDTGEMR